MTTTAAADIAPTIPLVDVEPLARPGDAAARRAADALCRAYEEVGFAYIVGHGVADGLIERCFAASAEFHAAPLEKKQSLAINGFHRGYMALATSTVVT